MVWPLNWKLLSTYDMVIFALHVFKRMEISFFSSKFYHSMEESNCLTAWTSRKKLLTVLLTYYSIRYLGKNIIVNPSSKTSVPLKDANFSFFAVPQEGLGCVKAADTSSNNNHVTILWHFSSSHSSPTCLKQVIDSPLLWPLHWRWY